MRIIADKNNKILQTAEESFSISCNVRTLNNGLRKSHEIVRSIPDELPYMPAPFPFGAWKITSVEWQDQEKFDYRTYGPVKIRTNAWQWVKVWELDKDGDYSRITEREIKDFGYLLHYSVSKTTLGCIRIEREEEAVRLGILLEKALKNGETITLEVL